MDIFDVLNLRTEYEILVLNMRVPGQYKHGTIEGLQWFSEHGLAKNKRFEGVKRAEEIANIVLRNMKILN